MRRIALVALVLAMITLVALLVPKGYARATAASVDAAPAMAKAASRSVEQAVRKVAPPPPTLRPGPVSTPSVKGFSSWALLDRRTNEISGGANLTAPNSTESMIKIWIVADFLRRSAAAGKQPTAAQLALASTAIRDSNDISAQALYLLNGRDQSTNRLIKTCGLTETKVVSGWWSKTQMSARDAVRMGLCVADQRAAGPAWTDWLLSEMRQVRGGVKDQPPGFRPTGGGRWGIIDGLPPELAAGIAIKNGWTPRADDGLWHINCLAVHQDWVLAVQARFPISLGLQYGANACRDVTRQLVHDPAAG